MSAPAEPRASREAAGHSRPQAAAVLGVSAAAWEKWERGERPMLPALLAYYRHVTGLERLPWRSIS